MKQHERLALSALFVPGTNPIDSYVLRHVCLSLDRVFLLTARFEQVDRFSRRDERVLQFVGADFGGDVVGPDKLAAASHLDGLTARSEDQCARLLDWHVE
jgi:hypothetical protein